MNKGASQYSRQSIASSGLVNLDFGFVASVLEVRNDGAGPAYLSFRGGSTGAFGTTYGVATTLDYPLTSGEVYHMDAMMTAGISIAASSTVGLVRVLALG